MKIIIQILFLAVKMIFHLIIGPTIIFFLRELVRQIRIGWMVIFQRKKILNVVLIRPSKYDDQTGFVLQDWKGVLPSNTLATLYSLIREIQSNLRLGTNVRLVIRVYDEAVQKVESAKIARLCKLFGAKSLVMLVGVQTNQFVRATDLALAFQKRGIQTIMGGFHISGVLAKFPQDKGESNQRAFQELGLQRLVENGVSLFAGEAEGRLLTVLQDFLAGELKPIYNFLEYPPDLEGESIPVIIPGFGKHFAIPHMGTIDACRGCPFKCTFCTIRTVQGTTIRARGVQGFKDAIRVNYQMGIRNYFFTSDNAARDPLWKERFDALIAMHEDEGIAIQFMMQADSRCHKIPQFVEKASQAGCNHVFIGLESVNSANLKAIGKKQNRPKEYHDLVSAFRSKGIAVHFSYMIGLPFDTKESVARDVQTLLALEPDMISFFMVVPLPGSDDHYRMFLEDEWMASDLNAYDGFSYPVSKHPQMSPEDWLAAYQAAWKTSLSVENLVRILSRTERKHYWRNFWNLAWYKYAIDVAQRHPMISGFVRVRDRKSLRNTFPRMGRLEFLRFEIQENFQTWKRTARLALDLMEVWLQTREKSTFEIKVTALKARTTRTDIQAYWRSVRSQLAKGKLWAPFRWKSIQAIKTDALIVWRFLNTLFYSWRAKQ